jgi:hypothetical protein
LKCVACDGEIGDAAKRCPSCGLVIAAETDKALYLRTDPKHVELYFGAAPQVVAGAGEADAPSAPETPVAVAKRTALSPQVRRRRWIVGTLVVVGLAAAIVALVRAHRPNDAWTKRELMFERFLSSPQLAHVEPPQADADAGVAAIGGDDPAVLAAATNLYSPLPATTGLTIHQFFDAFLERVLQIAPRRAAALGLARRPAAEMPDDTTATIARRLLCRDASRALRDWPGADRLSAHDRADRDALLGYVDTSTRWRPTRDLDHLHEYATVFDPLVSLADNPSRPAAERIAEAVDVLRDAMTRLAAPTERLKNPPRGLLLRTIETLEHAAPYLKGYANSWHDVTPAALAALRDAVAAAADAADACAQRLRDVLPRATGEAAIGPANVALLLRVRHDLPLDARTIYEDATEALRTAHDDMRRLRERVRESGEEVPSETAETQVRALRDAASAWVVAMPPEPGLVILPEPSLWAGRGAAASYSDSGTLEPAAIGVVHVGTARATRNWYERDTAALERHHTFAHETYPGHRMEALFRRKACPLRRFIDDRVFVEGWGVTAEELIHETGQCTGGPTDDYVRASRRADRAIDAMCELLLATGAASERELLELYVAIGQSKATLEHVGAAENESLRGLTYFVGVDEIRRLRRIEEKRLGAAFDLRAFHAKLLSEGPIPPRLIEEEWRESER